MLKVPCKSLSARVAAPRQQGAAVVELAVVLPVILLMLVGTVYYGYRAVLQNSVDQAAGNAAAQTMTARGSGEVAEPASIRSVVLASLSSVPPAAVTVTRTAGCVRVVLDTRVDGVLLFSPVTLFGVRVPPRLGDSDEITGAACYGAY